MNSLLKASAAALVTISVLCSASLLYCDEDELRTFRGNVQEIDFTGSLLTVASMDEMTFYVPSGTKIIWGTETVGLSDILQNDPVLVKYYDDPTGIPRAAMITLEREYSEF